MICVVKAFVGYVELCDRGGYFLCCDCMIVTHTCEYVIVESNLWAMRVCDCGRYFLSSVSM